MSWTGRRRVARSRTVHLGSIDFRPFPYSDAQRSFGQLGPDARIGEMLLDLHVERINSQDEVTAAPSSWKAQGHNRGADSGRIERGRPELAMQATRDRLEPSSRALSLAEN